MHWRVGCAHLQPNAGEPFHAAKVRPFGSATLLLSAQAHPDFLLRGTEDDIVCGFHQGKPHELCGTDRLNRKSGESRIWSFFSSMRKAKRDLACQTCFYFTDRENKSDRGMVLK
jgi:hypothetical protein